MRRNTHAGTAKYRMEVIHLKYMKAQITYEGMQRVERYFVPDAALREALLNALCHKMYQSYIPIQISVYEDKLYIANCGQLPENWTIDNLMNKHVSKPYNPSIANIFYLAGFIENWGRGIEKICYTCKEDGTPQPEYMIHPGDIMIKFTASEERIIRTTTHKVVDKLTGTERAILNLLNEDPAYSYAVLADKIGISKKTVFLHIKSLKEQGILERIGSDRKGYWKIISNK